MECKSISVTRRGWKAGWGFAGLTALLLAAQPASGTLQTPTVTFTPSTIAAGGTATLTVTLPNNPPPGTVSNIAFTSTYNANIRNAATPNVATTCGPGTAIAASLGGSLSLSGGSVSGNNSCTVTVTVTSCTAGSFTNAAFGVTSSAGNPTAPAATLTVTGSSPANAANSTVVAAPASVLADGTTSATITVTLLNSCGTAASGKSVSLSQGSGSSVISPASAVTNASGIATFTVTNQTAQAVTYTATDTTDGVTITQTAAVTFTALSAPTVAKSFTPNTVNTGQTSTLQLTITNPNSGTITGLAFTDTYPANLVNASTPGLLNSCGGTATASAGGNQLVLSGGSVAGKSSCTISVSVTSATAASYVNSTGPVTSNNATAGIAASATLTVNAAVTVSTFNVVETGASPVAGRIFTKVAGQDIVVDIVALDASNNLATGFTGSVTVQLVDNSGGGACASLPLVKALATETFAAGDSGRHPLSAGQFESNAYRNLKFRIQYPTASPTVTSCSGDSFANRPRQFASVQARDQDRTSAGVARVLNNTANPGTGTVHNAGRPFRVDATAQNGAATPATTTLYTPDAGQPVAVLAQCGVLAVCPATPGNVTTGAWSAASGVITTLTASYNDVGAFALTLEDQTFASVDAGDGTSTAVRYIRSAAPLTVGRFVPDYFTLEVGSAITPRSDIGACASSTFTYMDERMDLSFTLTARAGGGVPTPNYAGATLGALILNSGASYGFGAIDSAVPTPLTSRLDLSLISGVLASWSAGSATVTAPVTVTRAATPDGPYNQLKLGIAPVDPDGVALRSTDLNLDADNNASFERAQVGPATAVRFGRLVLQNAMGSENLDLPIPILVQSWAGSGFVTNTDDSCTSLAASNFSLANYSAGINAANLGASHISIGGAFSSGVGSLKLTKPSPVPASPGAVTLTVDLVAAAKPYLLGNWGVPTYTANPSARAVFGLYGSQPRNFIYYRENY